MIGKDNVLAIDIAKFGGLDFVLNYLECNNNLMCNIRVWQFCENFKEPMEMVKKDHYFQCLVKQGYVQA